MFDLVKQEVRHVRVRKSLICLMRLLSSSLLWSTFCLVLLVFIRTSWALCFASSAFSLATDTWRQTTGRNITLNQNQQRTGPTRTRSSLDQDLSDSPSWRVSPLLPWHWLCPVQSLEPSSKRCLQPWPHRHIHHLHIWSDHWSPHSPDLHKKKTSTSPDQMMNCHRSERPRRDEKNKEGYLQTDGN